jgi:hypothetical protein
MHQLHHLLDLFLSLESKKNSKISSWEGSCGERKAVIVVSSMGCQLVGICSYKLFSIIVYYKEITDKILQKFIEWVYYSFSKISYVFLVPSIYQQ